MLLENLSFKWKLGLFASMVIGLFFLRASLFANLLEQIQINGVIYNRIVQLKQLETQTGVPIGGQWNSNAKAAKKVLNEQFPPDPNLPDNANTDEPGWRGVDGAGVARTPDPATRTAATALIA